jgi:hypothetical protein
MTFVSVALASSLMRRWAWLAGCYWAMWLEPICRFFTVVARKKQQPLFVG